MAHVKNTDTSGKILFEAPPDLPVTSITFAAR